MYSIYKFLLALKIMRKHRIQYSPFSKLGHGSYRTYVNHIPQICVNPFDPESWEIFCHELGHHVCRRNNRVSLWENSYHWLEMWRDGEVYGAVIKEECEASVAAIRISGKLKIPIDKSILIKYFNTYLGKGFKCLSLENRDREELVSVVHSLAQKINKA